MSDSNAPLSDIRIKLGYIKPGEQYNKPLFWGNVIIFTSLVILVSFLFTCHNKRDASSNLQDRDLMYFAILSAVILGFFALPINIWDGLSYHYRGVYTVSRHPIYAFLLVLSILLLVSVGIYYASEGKDESAQKTLLIISMILLAVIIITCFLLFWIVNHPYGSLARLFKAQVLGDDELYAINSDLFVKYAEARKKNKILEEYMEKGKTLNKEEAESLGISDKDILSKIQANDYNYIKNDSTGNSITTLNAIIALSATSKKESYDYKAQLYNLGEFKSAFNSVVIKAEKLDEYNKAGKKELIFKKFMELRTKKLFFKDINLPKEPMEKLADYIKKSDDGRITAQQYSEIFGYYDNMTGVTNPGVYQNVREITDKYEKSVIDGFTSVFLDDLLNSFDHIKEESNTRQIIENKIRKFAIRNKNALLKNKASIIDIVSRYHEKFKDCTSNNTKFDFDGDEILDDGFDKFNKSKQEEFRSSIYKALDDCFNRHKLD